MTITWQKEIVFEVPTIKKSYPVPNLLDNIISMLPKNIVTSELSTILTELYNNAVDHGLLGLESELKQDDEGLVKYYNLRKKCLENLAGGFVRFEFFYKPHKKELIIEVSDSGQGFDCEKYINQPLLLFNRAGRGLYIINKLVNNFEYIADYNLIRLHYRVRQQEQISADYMSADIHLKTSFN